MLKLVRAVIPFPSPAFLITRVPTYSFSPLPQLPRICDSGYYCLHALADLHIRIAQSD